MVVGHDLTPYHAETLRIVSMPTHPAIFLLARNVWTIFRSSSSTEINWNLVGSSEATSLFRSGISATHPSHHVAQNSSTTTLPRRLCQSAFAPGGACSSCVNCNGGAGVPFSGSADAVNDPRRTVAKIARQRGQTAPRTCIRTKSAFMSTPTKYKVALEMSLRPKR